MILSVDEVAIITSLRYLTYFTALSTGIEYEMATPRTAKKKLLYNRRNLNPQSP